MKKWMFAAIAAVSLIAVTSQASVDCTKSDKGTLRAKRDWSALKNGQTTKARTEKQIVQKGSAKKAVR